MARLTNLGDNVKHHTWNIGQEMCDFPRKYDCYNFGLFCDEI